ncbi:hypothetical protein [Paenibacillus sp. OAS669]|uniref:hypothetical protein n=1 Tax=Paenibacillus sp. OAS669 TaxID=2663821 RepID=UPI00178A9C85|nr:hypothetical protein [Paenibacillus sp. OAS669]MBE1440832.1 cytochrome bd-type quinol oxidase subunit 1 [Paenibacillus sp. OAS669]
MITVTISEIVVIGRNLNGSVSAYSLPVVQPVKTTAQEAKTQQPRKLVPFRVRGLFALSQ